MGRGSRIQIRVKRLKGRNHIQIVDNTGYIHHILPINNQNIETYLLTLLISDYKKTFRTVKKYLTSQGSSEEEAKKKAFKYTSKIISDSISQFIIKLKDVDTFTSLTGNIEALIK